eukprot:6173113-Pleurochrysis_carterae.AAC.2
MQTWRRVSDPPTLVLNSREVPDSSHTDSRQTSVVGSKVLQKYQPSRAHLYSMPHHSNLPGLIVRASLTTCEATYLLCSPKGRNGHGSMRAEAGRRAGVSAHALRGNAQLQSRRE